MTKLVELGRVIAREQDALRAQQPRDERAADRFVRSVEELPERTSDRKRWLGVAAAVALAAAFVLGLTRFRETAHSQERSAGVVVGQPLVAEPGKTVPLRFPDGSQVVLTSGTEAVVHELTDTGASLEVARGEATVAVHHQAKTKWTIGAGPFRVRVTGTRFSVAWTPERERFELHLEQGSVVVSSDANAHSITMLAPETLVIDRGHWQVSPPVNPDANAAARGLGAALAPQTEPGAPAPALAPTGMDATAASAAAVSPIAPASPPAPGAPSWEALVRSGKYAAGYAEASRHGIAQLAESRPSSSLLSLAEGCRFSGHAADATRVLTRLRARFPGSDDAATAAFQLGRFAGDAAAITWFRTYLQERPNGALAREAAGRLLEAQGRSGDHASAQRAAEAYLERYPTGTHAGFARQLLKK